MLTQFIVDRHLVPIRVALQRGQPWYFSKANFDMLNSVFPGRGEPRELAFKEKGDIRRAAISTFLIEILQIREMHRISRAKADS